MKDRETSAPLRVCLWGTFERGYARNQVIAEALRAAGAEVSVCHIPVWEKTRDKTKGYGKLTGKLRLAADLASAQAQLVFRSLKDFRPDVILVGYLGHFDMPAAGLVGRMLGCPVVLDAFVSLYDTSVLDRGVVKAGTVMAGALHVIDRIACALADRTLVDTEDHALLFESDLNVPRAKLGVVPIGADVRNLHPRPRTANGEHFEVLHYGKFTPLHGLEFVIGAAQQLLNKAPNVRFHLIGTGQVKDEIVATTQRLGLTNVVFTDFIEQGQLVHRIAAADVCLGIFGSTPKARRVVPNKVYECMAMERPVITGRSPASERLLVHKRDVWMCEMANAQSLADAILHLKENPSIAQALGKRAGRTFDECFSASRLGDRLMAILGTVVREHRAG